MDFEIIVSWTESMADPHIQPIFAVCVANDGCDDLSTGMIYRVIPDEAAAAEDAHASRRTTRGDYLYPASRFVVVQVPPTDEQRVLAVASAIDT